MNVAVISQEDFAKIRPNSIIPNPSRPPPPPPINTPCVTGSLLPGQHDHTNDLDQLDFTFGDEEDDPNASLLNRSNRYLADFFAEFGQRFAFGNLPSLATLAN